MNDNEDILNLCRLTLMEDNIKDSPALDRDTTMKGIECKKRDLVTKITNNPSPIVDGAMEKHIKENTLEGVYPWDVSPMLEVPEDEI